MLTAYSSGCALDKIRSLRFSVTEHKRRPLLHSRRRSEGRLRLRISAFLSSRHKTGRLDCSADRFSQSRIELPTKRPASPAAASSQPRDSHSKAGTLPAIGFSGSALASNSLSFRHALGIHLRGHLSAQGELPLCNFPAVFAGCGFEHCVRINANGIARAFGER